MYKVIVEWHDQFAIIAIGSDFYHELSDKFPIEHKSQEEVENLIYKTLSNLPTNHYGKFEEQTEVIHKIIY